MNVIKRTVSQLSLDDVNVLDLIIVGGGLSGMVIAHEVHSRITQNWKLLEARSILGGRLMNMNNHIAVGGAWIWPKEQPNIDRLIRVLDIGTFRQPDNPQSIRIVGGAASIITRLQKDIPNDNISTETAVVNCRLVSVSGNKNDQKKDVVCLETVSPSTDTSTEPRLNTLWAKRVIFACPPKLLSKNVAFDPPLSEEKQVAMEQSQTWMAGVTKVALMYKTRFWKDADASTLGLPLNHGPSFQVYDASTNDGSIPALTFFALVPPDSSAANSDKVLADQCAHQIEQVWAAMGLPELVKEAKSYTQSFVQRWPLETYISEDSKPQQINPHPTPIHSLSTKEWNGALLFAGSEADTSSPGVMEGAVGSALRVVCDLKVLNSDPTK